jgi:amino acid transporter
MIAVALTMGRILFAAARDQAWPGRLNPLFATLSPRFGSPANATLALGALALPLIFVPIKLLIMINGNLNIAVYGTLALGVIAGRRRGLTSHSRARARLHPLAPAVVLASMAALTVADLFDPDAGRPALLAAAVIVGAGVLYAELLKRRSTRWRKTRAIG